MKLLDADPHGIDECAQHGLPVVHHAYHLVLQPSEAEVGLGEEVARSTGGIEEGQLGQLLLKRLQPFPPRLLHLHFPDLLQLFLEAVEEEGIDDLVDVLDAGVMHASRAACLRVQRGLKDSPEDGG